MLLISLLIAFFLIPLFELHKLVQLKTFRGLPFLTEILQYQRKGFMTHSA